MRKKSRRSPLSKETGSEEKVQRTKSFLRSLSRERNRSFLGLISQQTPRQKRRENIQAKG